MRAHQTGPSASMEKRSGKAFSYRPDNARGRDHSASSAHPAFGLPILYALPIVPAVEAHSFHINKMEFVRFDSCFRNIPQKKLESSITTPLPGSLSPFCLCLPSIIVLQQTNLPKRESVLAKHPRSFYSVRTKSSLTTFDDPWIRNNCNLLTDSLKTKVETEKRRPFSSDSFHPSQS